MALFYPFFILGSYNFLAYLECVRSYAWSKGHSDPDLGSVCSATAMICTGTYFIVYTGPYYVLGNIMHQQSTVAHILSQVYHTVHCIKVLNLVYINCFLFRQRIPKIGMCNMQLSTLLAVGKPNQNLKIRKEYTIKISLIFKFKNGTIFFLISQSKSFHHYSLL